jgi:hypothetical protein
MSPGVLNVNRNVAIAPRSPESKVVPSSEVAVCVIPALFVQQTVVPGSIVTSLGVNEKFAIATLTSPAWQPPPAGRVAEA